MTDWIDEPAGLVVEALTEVPLAQRNSWRDGPSAIENFREAHESITALRQVEVGGPPPVASGAKGRLRVVAWNVERLRHLGAIGDRIESCVPDVCLLSEIDKGMARTQNGHRVLELAERLGQGYAYGVEFVELDRGDVRERSAHASVDNAIGFHGNAILTRLVLRRPAIMRLEAEGKWFGWDRGEPRVGGRMAIAGQVRLDGTWVTVVAVHLESHSDPDHRAMQTERLLDLVDRYDPDAPVLIGGDFNTSTVARGERPDLGDPDRLVDVQPYEPLFGLMRSRGFDWESCNVPKAPTQRLWEPDPERRLGKIDWFFVRGLRALNPSVLPATYPDGATSSDHEGLFVEVGLIDPNVYQDVNGLGR